MNPVESLEESDKMFVVEV